MIENKLSLFELKRILKPILTIMPSSTILKEFENVYKFKVSEVDDVTCQNNYLVTYNKYQVDVRGLGELDYGTYITLQFRLEKHWLHGIINPSNKVIRDLKNIVLECLPDFNFKKYVHSFNDGEPGLPKMVNVNYFIDSRAFNSKWDNGDEISPLLIVGSSNDKYLFIELSFNPNCYEKSKDSILLKKDWLNYIKDRETFINNKADEMLKHGFKSRN